MVRCDANYVLSGKGYQSKEYSKYCHLVESSRTWTCCVQQVHGAIDCIQLFLKGERDKYIHNRIYAVAHLKELKIVL